MKLTVHLADPEEEYHVEVDARDRRSFERLAVRDLGKIADGHLKDTINRVPEVYVAWLAWHALCVRTKVADLRWVEFDARLVETETEDDEEEAPNPT